MDPSLRFGVSEKAKLQHDQKDIILVDSRPLHKSLF